MIGDPRARGLPKVSQGLAKEAVMGLRKRTQELFEMLGQPAEAVPAAAAGDPPVRPEPAPVADRAPDEPKPADRPAEGPRPAIVSEVDAPSPLPKPPGVARPASGGVRP